jgi:hypothetical protein
MFKKLLYWFDAWWNPGDQDYYCTRCERSKWGISKFGCGLSDPLSSLVYRREVQPPCKTAPLEFQSSFRRWLRDRHGIILA